MNDRAFFAAAASLLRAIDAEDPKRRVAHLIAYAEKRAAEERAKGAESGLRARESDDRVSAGITAGVAP